MLAHLLAVGALDILIAVALAHPQQLVGILEAIRRGCRLPILLTTGMAPLILAMGLIEEVHLRFGHRQNAGQLNATETQLVGNGMQNGALALLHLPVGKGRLQLHFEEEAQDIALPQTGTAELGQSLAQREVGLLTETKRLLRPGTLFARQPHPIHHLAA